MEVTLNKIAKELKISVSTVSKAMSGSDSVSESTKKAVFEAVEKFNYNLRKINCKTIAFVIDKESFNLSSQFYAPIISSIEQELIKNKYYFQFSTIDRDNFKLETINLNFKDLAGVIMVCFYHDDFVLKLKKLGIPIVLLDYYIPTEDVQTILVDNADGILRICKYLVSLGHKRIGYISGENIETSTHERLYGFRVAQNLYGLEVDEDLVIMNNKLNIDEGFKAMKLILDLDKKPSAVVCYNDLLAIGAIEAIKNRGLSVPEDISVTGFDDIKLSKEIKPSLTTIHIPLEDMGVLTADRLVEIIKGVKKPLQKMLISTELIIRDSTSKRS
jgi:DNA-binding LacI/PurR family transcriptional regulator